MKVAAIALNTFRESVREKILYTVGVFGLLLIGSSYVLSPLAVGARHKMIADVGLASVSLLGVVVLILVGTSLIHREIDRRIIFIVLSKPVSRAQYLLGKYFGIVLTLGAVVLAMGMLYFSVLVFDGIGFGSVYAAAIWMSFVELMVLASVAVFFSSFTNHTLTALFTLSVFVMGHLSADLRSFAERVGGPAMKAATEFMFYALPNLEAFNIRAEAVHSIEIGASRIAISSLYGFAYVAFALALATILFNRKDLK